jgi:hypothetical protein
MSIFEDTNPKKLKELLGQIDKREAVLPDFQRDFVWEPNATKELIISIMQNYPAGSLLRIRNVQNMFAVRQFEGAEKLKENQPPIFLVLDGQQRLTSLYQAFYGKGNYRYYINIRKLLDNNGVELSDCVFYVKSNEDMFYSKSENQVNHLVLPLGILKGELSNFTNWVQSAVMHISGTNPNEVITMLQTLNKFGADWIQTIDHYDFPVVTLSDKTGAEAVCNIFETLNRTGVKLSPFELLVARFYPRQVYLRHLWDKAVQDYPIIEDFDIDPYYILLVITLAANRTPSAKRGDVLQLTSIVVDRWWEPAVKGMATALEILRDDCGVLNPDWLPYNTIVYSMAAVIAKRPFPQGPGAAVMRNQLIRWFWCSVFSQTYESSPTSQAATDVTQLLVWLEGGEAPESVANFERKFRPSSLRETTSRQRAVYRGVIALIMSHHPLDFYTGKQITPKLLLSDKMDANRIFPAAYLKSLGIKGDRADNVLNRTMIGRDTNQKIGAKKPSDYFYEIELGLKTVSPQLYDELLESHILPTGDDSPLKADDYEAFLDWRLNAIWLEIQAVTMDTATTPLPVAFNFPQVNRISDDQLRQNINTAVSKLNENTVHNALKELDLMFEGTLKAYLILAHQKGLITGNSPANMQLNDLVYAYCKLHSEADKPTLIYLKEVRNSNSHPHPGTYLPSLEKRRDMLRKAPMVVGWFIDYIKLFDEQKAQL